MGSHSESLELRITRLVAAIPAGRVATYGQIAAMAGNHRGARQVVRVLHSMDHLPWHRVVNRFGTISLAEGAGYEEQRSRLEAEGVAFDGEERIDLARYLWRPDNDTSAGDR